MKIISLLARLLGSAASLLAIAAWLFMNQSLKAAVNPAEAREGRTGS